MSKYIIQKKTKEQSGATLVMSLLILSLAMASAIALSRVILGEIRMTINTSNSLRAFYAADSAIEKSLYYIKYSKINGDDQTLNNLRNTLFSMDGNQFFNFAEVSTTTQGFAFYDITTSTPAHIDILDPTGNITNIEWNASLATHYYTIDWSIDNCFPTHASDKLEVTGYSFTNPVSGFAVAVDKDVRLCNCAYNADIDISNTCVEALTEKTIFTDRFYRFSFRPLDSTVKSLFFKTFIDGTPPTQIGAVSNTKIIADGIYRNAKYRLQVEIPATSPLSDIFSYVIFSEEVLRKN